MNTSTYIGSAMMSVIVATSSFAYEIPNHADMSGAAADISILRRDIGANGKLFRLGLRPYLVLDDLRQTFPLAPSPEIGICYGIQVDPITGQPILINGKLVPDTANQPPWGQDAGRTQMTIAQLFRYGACYEDNEGPVPLADQRPLAHFYDPQHQGRGLTSALIGPVPSSLEWMLKPAATSDATGTNHYGWSDARDAFFDALTFNSNIASVNAADNALLRKLKWAKTFQSLGHITHHLQDMAQPQHVRNDDHCDATACVGPVYKPSGYEKHMLNNRLSFVRTLAQSASAPILFGLPREFWNMNTDNALQTTNPVQVASADAGLAAYTSTNFVSAGTDFRLRGSNELRALLPAADYGLPAPSGQWDDVTLATLYANTPGGVPSVFRDVLCSGDASACKMRFMGTSTNPSAKTSSVSIFAPEMFNPANAFTGDREGVFQQNYFTYDDAAAKLIPKAVEYSAGLINYFFRGEMEISLPEEGVYGVLDHAVEKTKGADGFRLLKMKVKNTTLEINTARGVIAQNMTNGEFRAVAKFRRNTCYTANLMGQIGTIVKGDGTIVQDNALDACRSAVEEIVASEVEPAVSSLTAGAEATTMTFDFPNPIPIEATDLFLQVVFKGALGEELGAIAVATKDVSEPSFVTYANWFDYKACSMKSVVYPTETQFVDCGDFDADTMPFHIDNIPDYCPDPKVVIDGIVVLPGCTGRTYAMANEMSARYAPEYMRWLGMSHTDPNLMLARFPDAGINGGNFARLAVISDLKAAGQLALAAEGLTGIGGISTSLRASDVVVRHGMQTSNGEPFSLAFDQHPFAINPADYHRPIAPITTTVVQGVAEPNEPPLTLPSYWLSRGVVIGVIRAGDGDVGLFPGIINYVGEPNLGGAVNLLAQPKLKTIIDRYPPAKSSLPVAFGRIAFTRGNSERVAANDTTLRIANTSESTNLGYYYTAVGPYPGMDYQWGARSHSAFSAKFLFNTWRGR